MKRYLLDSNSLEHYVHRTGRVFQRAKLEVSRGAAIGTAIPIIAEMLGGLHYSRTRERNLPIFRLAIRKISKWPLDMKAAEEYGMLWALLRSNGIQIQDMDLMAAAIACTLTDCTIVSTDSDFQHVPDLQVEDWTL